MVDWGQNSKLLTEISKIAVYIKHVSDYIQISHKQKLKLPGRCAKNFWIKMTKKLAKNNFLNRFGHKDRF